MADCRMCRFFVPVQELDQATLERAWMMAAKYKYRPGQLLGWCKRYRWPVTRYTVSCRGYEPRGPGRSRDRSGDLLRMLQRG